MSLNGGQNHRKDGGAHENPHGSTDFVNNSEITEDFSGKNSYFDGQTGQDNVQPIQNGGHGTVMAKGCLAAQSLQIMESDEIFSVVDNSEWLNLKDKIRKMGNVELITQNVSLINSALLEKGSEGARVKDKIYVANGDFLVVNDCSASTKEATELPDSAITLCSDATVLNGESLLTARPSETVVSSSHSRPSSPSHYLNPVHMGTSTKRATRDLTGGSGAYSVGAAEGTAELSSQDKACLEELERGSQLSQEEKEMIENSRKELQAALEFRTLEQDQSNTLMTAQELENMPDRGLEFEESVGPKEQLLSTSQNTDLDSLVATATENLINGTLPNLKLEGNNSVHITTNSNSIKNSHSTSKATPKPASSSINAPSSQSSLATISISTDQRANVTNICINTSQGQQIFQINTTDISQASAALQPQKIMGSVTHVERSGLVGSTMGVGGLSVQDGYLVIPVSQANGGQSAGNVLAVDGGLSADPENGVASRAGLAKQVEGIQCVENRSSSEISAEDLEAMDTENLDELDPDDEYDGNPAYIGRLWPCTESGCDKVFKKPSKLRIHLMNHTGERPYRCCVEGCDWAFTTKYKLKRHEESHQGKKDFVCDVAGCGRKFTTIYNLNSHRKLHERPCTETCPEPGCEASFPTKRKLDLHMKNHEGAAKTYKCPIAGCDKTFFSPNCMGSHARVHQQERDLTCKFEGCGKVFDKLCRLKQHMRSHTGEKPYICAVEGCGWAFSTASKLKRHQRKHTGERKWICPEKGCGKAFMRAEHLKGHMVTHSGEKPYRCPVEGCRARFSAKSSMYVHMKKHNQASSGEKVMYICPLEGCDRKYTNKTSIRSHIAKHYALSTDIGLIPIFNPEDLQHNFESLVQGTEDTTAGSSAGNLPTVPNSILTQDGSIINPVDLIATGDEPVIASAQYTDVVNQPVITSSTEVSQPISGVDLGHVTSTFQGTTVASVNDSETPKIMIATDLDLSGVFQENNSGSARTDYRSNHMLSDRARKRRKLLKEKANLYMSSGITEDGKSSDILTPPSPEPTFHPTELMTSRAITFRDPETGATYVQTQLLQDDPPNPEIYSEDGTCMSGADDADLDTSLHLSVLQDATAGADQHATVVFTETINLQDLE